MAIPLCCCKAYTDIVKKSTNCCHSEPDSGETDHSPEACACASLDAKETPESIRLPDAYGKEFITYTSVAAGLPASRILPMPASARPGVVDDPPGKIFARYSRWII